MVFKLLIDTSSDKYLLNNFSNMNSCSRFIHNTIPQAMININVHIKPWFCNEEAIKIIELCLQVVLNRMPNYTNYLVDHEFGIHYLVKSKSSKLYKRGTKDTRGTDKLINRK